MVWKQKSLLVQQNPEMHDNSILEAQTNLYKESSVVLKIAFVHFPWANFSV